MRFLSLFSGIGGLDLGLERAGMTCVGQVEIDPYCRAVLTKHWPSVKRMEDVREVKGDEFGPIDVVCGGFPCQGTSNAGRRRGMSDHRTMLWGDAARIVDVARPGFVVLENPSALLARGMGRVLGDLAAIGYDAEWDCYPAHAFGGLHERDRVFIVAYPVRPGRRRVLCDDVRTVPTPVLRRETDALDDACESCKRFAQGLGEPLAFRSSDGIPNRMDRLEACGDAVYVPIIEMIGRAIMEYQHG